MGSGLRIGEVAGQAGVNVQTLRFYERRGLLKEPTRLASGYREYGRDAVGLVRFIKRSQELGFSLKEIDELLALRDGKETGCAEAKRAAETKISDIDRKLASLAAMRSALAALVRSCGSGDRRHCPLIEAINRSAETDVLLREPGEKRPRRPNGRKGQ
ncbi:MAG: MerR family DNA-binding protein [Myxococcaceae bacterium]